MKQPKQSSAVITFDVSSYETWPNAIRGKTARDIPFVECIVCGLKTIELSQVFAGKITACRCYMKFKGDKTLTERMNSVRRLFENYRLVQLEEKMKAKQ